jgi:glycosyltransferase involved in cell wall biosynthesis
MANKSVSVVINTLNEERNIEKCIHSLAGFADEILVCDMFSDDNTVRLAEAMGARVIYHPKAGYVEPARYHAVASALGKWILILDADEYLTDETKVKLLEIVAQDESDLVRMGKLCFYFTRYMRYGGFYRKTYPLFFTKDLYIKHYTPKNGTIFKGLTHLTENAKQTEHIGGSHFVMHDAYPSIEKYVIKTDGAYAQIEAQTLHKEGKRFRLWMMLLDPSMTFIKKFIFQRGFLEGLNGFILCILYSNYRFNVWANLWLLETQTVESTKNIKEVAWEN